MPGIALDSATKGRLRPSFFLLLGLPLCAWAQQAVFRCGQEYTNAPTDASRCERVAPQAITVIAGTRVQATSTASPATSPAPQSTVSVSPLPAASAPQQQRDDMARHILHTELVQARERHANLLQDYKKIQTERHAEDAGELQKHQQRMAHLQAAIDRSQRDIDSLEREIARRPASSTKR